jgi:hypothetical protein
MSRLPSRIPPSLFLFHHRSDIAQGKNDFPCVNGILARCKSQCHTPVQTATLHPASMLQDSKAWESKLYSSLFESTAQFCGPFHPNLQRPKTSLVAASSPPNQQIAIGDGLYSARRSGRTKHRRLPSLPGAPSDLCANESPIREDFQDGVYRTVIRTSHLAAEGAS